MNVNKASPAYRAAVTGVLCALAAGVSSLEGLLPALPVPGAKPGLANIVTMTALFSMGIPSALAVTLVKAFFALFRGGTAFILSLSGGLLSLGVMTVIYKVSALRKSTSFIGVGVAGAAAHNTGQLIAAAAMLGRGIWLLAAPLLAISVAAGIITGFTLNLVWRYFVREGDFHGNIKTSSLE